MHMEAMEIPTASCCPESQKERKIGSTILDCFSKIVKDDERERLNGGVSLLRHISIKKSVSVILLLCNLTIFVQIDVNNSICRFVTLKEGTDGKEFNYAVTRLVRGLGSSRAVSRKGFYSTLTAYLKTNQDTHVEDLLKLMETELRPVSSNPKGVS